MIVWIVIKGVDEVQDA